MEKKLSDYAGYYLGSRCINSSKKYDYAFNKEYILESFNPNSPHPYILWNGYELICVDSIKPILRRLEDMTNEEAIELARLIVHSEEFTNVITLRNPYGDIMVIWGNHSESEETRYNATAERCWSADQFHYLLKQGFDLWNLIDAGLAVDEKILTK